MCDPNLAVRAALGHPGPAPNVDAEVRRANEQFRHMMYAKIDAETASKRAADERKNVAAIELAAMLSEYVGHQVTPDSVKALLRDRWEYVSRRAHVIHKFGSGET